MPNLWRKDFWGFTGSQVLRPEEVPFVAKVLGDYCKDYKPLCVVTGGCIGVDSFVGRWFAENMPSVKQLVVLPRNKKKVHRWWDVDDYADLLKQRVIMVEDYGLDYMARNEEIVKDSDILIAFPRTRVERLRSGTWSTVRRAQRSDMPIFIHPLENAAA